MENKNIRNDKMPNPTAALAKLNEEPRNNPSWCGPTLARSTLQDFKINK